MAFCCPGATSRAGDTQPGRFHGTQRNKIETMAGDIVGDVPVHALVIYKRLRHVLSGRTAVTLGVDS